MMDDEGRRTKDEGRRTLRDFLSSFVLRPSSFVLRPSSFVSLCLIVSMLLTACESSGGGGERVRLVITPVATPTATPQPPPTVGQSTYAVRAGDTLSSIASQFGVSVDDIVRANNIADPNALADGQTLTIPAHSVTTPVIPSAEAGSPTVQLTPPLPPPDVTPPQGPTAEP